MEFSIVDFIRQFEKSSCKTRPLKSSLSSQILFKSDVKENILTTVISFKSSNQLLTS